MTQHHPAGGATPVLTAEEHLEAAVVTALSNHPGGIQAAGFDLSGVNWALVMSAFMQLVQAFKSPSA